MLYASLNTFQDGATPADAASKPAAAAPDELQEAAKQLITDPTAAVSRWGDAAWEITKTYGPGIVSAIVLLTIAYIAARWVRRLVIRACNAAKIDITLGKFFGNLAKWGVILFALVTAAGTLGISTTGFAAAIGAAGLAIGLALQGNLGNLAAGVLLLIFRPFKIGDAVIVAGQSGIVDGIDLFTTNLDTADNRRLIVPNAAIFGGTIENQTYHPERRIDYTIAVNGAIDSEITRKHLSAMLADIVALNIGALHKPSPTVQLTEIAPAQTWTISLWAQTPRSGAVREQLLLAVRRTLTENDLSPAPGVQLVKHVT